MRFAFESEYFERDARENLPEVIGSDDLGQECDARLKAKTHECLEGDGLEVIATLRKKVAGTQRYGPNPEPEKIIVGAICTTLDIDKVVFADDLIALFIGGEEESSRCIKAGETPIGAKGETVKAYERDTCIGNGRERIADKASTNIAIGCDMGRFVAARGIEITMWQND